MGTQSKVKVVWVNCSETISNQLFDNAFNYPPQTLPTHLSRVAERTIDWWVTGLKSMSHWSTCLFWWTGMLYMTKMWTFIKYNTYIHVKTVHGIYVMFLLQLNIIFRFLLFLFLQFGV